MVAYKRILNENEKDKAMNENINKIVNLLKMKKISFFREHPVPERHILRPLLQ